MKHMSADEWVFAQTQQSKPGGNRAKAMNAQRWETLGSSFPLKMCSAFSKKLVIGFFS